MLAQFAWAEKTISMNPVLVLPYEAFCRYLRSTSLRRRYHDLNQAGGYVIDEAGDKPLARQRRYRPERGNIDSHRNARIGD